jgi:hypothetical protein
MDNAAVYDMLRAGQNGRGRAYAAAIDLLQNTPTRWFAPYTGLGARLIIDGDRAFVDPEAADDLARGAFTLSAGERLVLALALHLMLGRPSVDLCRIAAGVDPSYLGPALTAIEHTLRVPTTQP